MSVALDEKQPEKTPKYEPRESGCVPAGVIMFFLLVVGSIMAWPWTTEGVISSVDYSRLGETNVSIKFDDGRVITLKGQPTRSLVVGKYYVITYNNLRFFYNVEEVDRK